MRKITNKDIAAAAGVSPAAVSMAIHGRNGISEQTRAHILQIVQEMNYVPPTRTDTAIRNSSIVLAGDDLSGRLAPSFLSALLLFAQKQNAEVCFLSSEQLADHPQERLMRCMLLILFGEPDEKLLEQLKTLVPKILTVDGIGSHEELYNIRLNYSGAAYALTRYLTQLGHRGIAYINQELAASKNLLVFSGFQRMMLEMHLTLNPTQVVMDAAADPHIWAHLPQIVHANNVSAVFCTSDRAAVTAANILQKNGFRIPEDVSVVTLVSDDTAVHPGFSFTRVSLNVSGTAQALSALLTQNRRSAEQRDILIPCSAVLQGSSTAQPNFDPTAKKLAIALILKEHPTYRLVRAGFLNKVQQLGYQAEVVGIADTDAAEFRKVCLSLKHSDVEGVVIWNPTSDVIRELSDAGIAVVCPHLNIKNGAQLGLRANIAADPVRSAENVAQYFAARFADKSGVIAVSQTEDTEQENAVTRELILQMKELCPNIRVQNDLMFVEHSEQNVELLRQYITKTPELLAAFTTAGEACITWAAAKKAADRHDMVIVGTDYTEATLALLESGEVDAFLAQPLYEETQMSVTALDAILRGNAFPYFTALDAPLVTKQTAEPYERLLQEVKNWYV